MKKKRRAIILNVHVSIREFLRHLLAEKGYEVVARSHSMRCLETGTAENACLHRPPCAEIFIMELNESHRNNLALLLRQSRFGCGIAVKNKAVIAGVADSERQSQFERLGCTWFTIPFDFTRLSNWIDACNDRGAPPKSHGADNTARGLPRMEDHGETS